MTILPPELAAIAETEMPCTCAPDYKQYGGVDPACRCGDRDRAIAAAVNIQTRARLAEQDAVHADLSALLEALGMGTHARPQSSHEVMLECIGRVRVLAGNEPGLYQAVNEAIKDAVAATVTAGRDRWRAVLADHYLMDIRCNRDTRQDNPVCGCSRVFLGWHPSIGAARQAWIDHVTSVLEES